MNDHVDHNALLLQVMAHDLLAPLTATKWQIELLANAYKDTEKRERYLKGMADSTELGITLTKHAHVAGRVLSHSYSGEKEKNKPSQVIGQVMADLRLQYERHALVLEESIDPESTEQDIDVELMRLFIWAIAKFFLTCVPPQTVVRMDGFQTPEGPNGGKYVFMVTAKGIQNAQECMEIISNLEPKGSLDQTYVFSKLLHEIVSILGISFVPSTEADTFTLTATF